MRLIDADALRDEWLYETGTFEPNIDFQDWKCSICGTVMEQPKMPFYNYCPNCGAKMEVQNESVF